jgi:hypothetical protein
MEGVKILARAGLLDVASFFEKYALSLVISCFLAKLALNKEGARTSEGLSEFREGVTYGCLLAVWTCVVPGCNNDFAIRP